MWRTVRPATNPYLGAAARSRLYALLCVAAAPAEAWVAEWLQQRLGRLDLLLRARLPFPVPRPGLGALRRGLRLAPHRELAVEHHRLTAMAPPYASHYTEPDGQLMGAAAGAALRAYRAAGLMPDGAGRDLPDHLVTELEFMAGMAEQEAACWRHHRPDQAARWLTLQEQFLRAHMQQWVPTWAGRTRVAEPLAYFRFLCGLTEEAVCLDLVWITGLRRRLAADGVRAAGA